MSAVTSAPTTIGETTPPTSVPAGAPSPASGSTGAPGFYSSTSASAGTTGTTATARATGTGSYASGVTSTTPTTEATSAAAFLVIQDRLPKLAPCGCGSRFQQRRQERGSSQNQGDGPDKNLAQKRLPLNVGQARDVVEQSRQAMVVGRHPRRELGVRVRSKSAARGPRRARRRSASRPPPSSAGTCALHPR